METNRRSVIALALALLCTSVAAEAASGTDTQNTLVGAWRLVRYEDVPATGSSSFPFGRNPRGLLIYTPTGQMSIQVMAQPHPTVASGDEETITSQEKQALFDAFMAYFGTYEVDASRGVVIHHVEGDLWGVFDDNDEARPFEISGNTLMLKPRWESGGKQWLGIRVFERATAPANGD